MKNLGIIMAPDGSYKKFGIWKPREERDDETSCYHNNSFCHEVLQTDWFQKFQLRYDSTKKFQTQLDTLALQNCLIVLNIAEKDRNQTITQAVWLVATKLLPEQVTSLMDLESELLEGSGKYDQIDVIESVNGVYLNYVDDYENMEDFFKKEVKKQCNSKSL